MLNFDKLNPVKPFDTCTMDPVKPICVKIRENRIG